jgi:hypothetical protein
MKTTFRLIESELVITIAKADSGADEAEVLRMDSEVPNIEVGNRDVAFSKGSRKLQ